MGNKLVLTTEDVDTIKRSLKKSLEGIDHRYSSIRRIPLQEKIKDVLGKLESIS